MSGHPEVGVAGLGVMGSAIARRLLRRERTVRVYDVRQDAVAELARDGAQPVDSAARLASSSVVILSLNTADIVEQVVFGPEGVLTATPEGVLVIDMSSIDPGRTRAFAERAAKLGAGWVDAPLSGGAPGAERGELTLMLGGEEEDVERALHVLGALSSQLTHIGPPGSGQLVKSVNQVLVGCGFAALAEAAALVRAAGLPPRQVQAALTGGRADSALFQEFFVKFAEVDLTPTGRVSNMVKDLEAARDYARSAGVPLPVTTAVSELHRWLAAAGHGEADNAALMHYYETGTGVGTGDRTGVGTGRTGARS
ncbi:NAD(P)-dependent oxidoreductase [Streptomyces sp. NBC_00576]|uniref:NAD(P)-dependent oxidoreductase n=1 Tax=Streptomyces sp. NBC_00576 TaxID=2903665 RepID=UPI002E81ED51|nr:NAD(P)-dependent oxidoreductase [Streptomyces sp. NBC_00576]WUB73197.1 NAD(P)-dependent oxidoreductase [Streptomyces sp. NBC_00576]